jgi:hypothetical protein
MEELYYTAPSDEVFEELKKAAIKIWNEYDNEHGYVDEKVGRIKDLENSGDNFMYIFAMFDIMNQQKLVTLVSLPVIEALAERLEDNWIVPFLEIARMRAKKKD